MPQSGVYITASGVYRIPRNAEINVAGGWKVQLAFSSDWSGNVTFNRNSTAQVGDGLISSLITACPFYYASTQAQATTGMNVTGSSTWLVPFLGYELYLLATQTIPNLGSVTVTISPMAPVASTAPIMSLAQIDLSQGIPLHYPDDLKFQFQLAADNQPASYTAPVTTI